ncbi:MAG: tyrosine-type recombinase/integrase [Patescibacteria group bacterium]
MAEIINIDKNNLKIVDDFLNWLAIGHSLETVDSYKWPLRLFCKWLSGKEKNIADMKEKDFVGYHLFLKEERQVKNSTMAHYFTSIRTLWRYMYRNEMVKYGDDKIPMPKADDKQSYPYAEEADINKILNSFRGWDIKDIRDKAIVSLLYKTGLRIGELRSLDISDIDLEFKKATVQTEKRTGHKREIYWDDKTNEYLKNWIDTREEFLLQERRSENALFIGMTMGSKDKRIDRSTVQKMFRKKRDELGINKKLTPHSCRHGFGHRAVEKNVNIRHLQVMLGHSKIDTTMIYMGCKNKDVETAYRQLMFA